MSIYLGIAIILGCMLYAIYVLFTAMREGGFGRGRGGPGGPPWMRRPESGKEESKGDDVRKRFEAMRLEWEKKLEAGRGKEAEKKESDEAQKRREEFFKRLREGGRGGPGFGRGGFGGPGGGGGFGGPSGGRPPFGGGGRGGR